ncbi:MAG: hypothetical protein QOF73_3977 [Thermomicrobiales bacterium]|nr:hypothetical protein [Thermomicrobiales bacterium]
MIAVDRPSVVTGIAPQNELPSLSTSVGGEVRRSPAPVDIVAVEPDTFWQEYDVLWFR